MVKLKNSGADLFYNISDTPKFAAQAIKKAAEMNWKPVDILDINASGVAEVMKPAGVEPSKGIISVNYGKDMYDPQWQNDEGMKRSLGPSWTSIIQVATRLSSFNGYGYSTSQLLVEILKPLRRRSHAR